MKRLNFGCGRGVKPPDEGWVNLDLEPGEGIQLVCDLDTQVIPVPDDYFDELYGWHVIEHLKNPLHAMQELWRVAKPGAACYLRCPYGSSDDAFEDPTHVRQYFINSFGYFSQPFYWRADYGYRGDWKPELIQLTVSKEIKPMGLDRLREMVHTQRNVVQEMGVKLVAVKPARQPKAELQTPFDIRFNFV